MPIVLILLGLGGLLIIPTLNYASTSLKGHQVTETKTMELYAADSGVEDAFYWLQHWLIENWSQQGGEPRVPWTWNADENLWERDPPLEVNDKTVYVTVVRVDAQTYKITSTAGSTTVESYVESIPGGNLDIFSGALSSKGDISLGKDSTVTGDIYYGGTFTHGSGFTHNDGEVIEVGPEAFPTQEDDEEFAQKLKDEALVGGTLPGLTVDSDIELGPKYINGDLYITQDVTINLTGTIYVEGSITAKKDYTVTGSGSIVAVGNIYLSKLADYGIGGDSIIMSLNGNITFKKEATIEALIYAPNGTISFDKSATVIGGVVGAEIQADKEGSFTYIPSSSPIELPGSLPGRLEVKTYSINPSV